MDILDDIEDYISYIVPANSGLIIITNDNGGNKNQTKYMENVSHLNYLRKVGGGGGVSGPPGEDLRSEVPWLRH